MDSAGKVSVTQRPVTRGPPAPCRPPNEIAVRCPAPLGSEPPPGPENPLPRPPSRLGFLELRSVILGTQKRKQKDKDYK